jgi:hypothetical protein
MGIFFYRGFSFVFFFGFFFYQLFLFGRQLDNATTASIKGSRRVVVITFTACSEFDLTFF